MSSTHQLEAFNKASLIIHLTDQTMEPLGSAVSIITVVTIALQSAKAIYGTMNGIRNGPKEVKYLASVVNELYHMIGQVTEMGIRISDDDSNTISELRRMNKECSETLDDGQNQLRKLKVLPGEGKFGKAWKSVKLIIQRILRRWRGMCIITPGLWSAVGFDYGVS